MFGTNFLFFRFLQATGLLFMYIVSDTDKGESGYIKFYEGLKCKTICARSEV